ncbi:hypothetical protein FRC05_009262 [Tulasnella sp. 425]|nr:hypothetical protein FRC05_009262 [Tulasnella sp. 425]
MSGFDPNTDLVLRWEFDPDEMRKLTIWMTHPQSQEDLKLYNAQHGLTVSIHRLDGLEEQEQQQVE